MLSVLNAGKKRIGTVFRSGILLYWFTFLFNGLEGWKAISTNKSPNFLYLCIYVLTIYLHLPLSKQDYKLICYNIQINEANSYAKFGISSFFKQPFNKIPLGIIILVMLYGLPKQRTKRETKLWWSFSILTGMKKKSAQGYSKNHTSSDVL